MTDQDSQDKRDQALLERILSLKQMLQEGRGGPIDRHDLAICYFLIENYQRCTDTLSEIIKTTPDYIDISRVYSLQSLALVKLQRYTEAQSLIAKRLVVEPDDLILLNLLGYVYEKLNQPQKAIEAHRRVLSIDKDHPNSLNSLGYLLTLHGDEASLTEAGSSLKRAVELNRSSAAYYDSLGVYLARLNSFERAKQALVKALELDPQNIEIIDHLKQVAKKESEHKKQSKLSEKRDSSSH